MANEIFDIIKAAITDSGANNDELYNTLKEKLPSNGSFKDFIIQRKNSDIGRYETIIPLENNVLIITLVKESNDSYIKNSVSSNFNEVKPSLRINNFYAYVRESTGLYPYSGVLPRYHLDYESEKKFNPSIILQDVKEKLL